MNRIAFLIALFSNLMVLQSCSQEGTTVQDFQNLKVTTEEPVKDHHEESHPYGGWSCPDNMTMFPPLDLIDLEKIPIVKDRLPTREEVESGASLMFIDEEEYPDAMALEIELPRVARYYSNYTKKNELVIVIQAVKMESDSVVGFRYLNGGNGSAWIDEVEFIDQSELANIGSTPFVFFEEVIDASPGEIWKVITDPHYMKITGGLFNETAFRVPLELDDSEVYYQFAPETKTPRGKVTAFWEQLYIQVDYNFDGRHYAQKILLLPQQGKGGTKLQIASGPYGNDFVEQEQVWSGWFRKVKQLSEGFQIR